MSREISRLERGFMTQSAEFILHRGCFACGRHAADGLGLEFKQNGQSLCCSVTLDSKFQSYGGIIHGGILATVADAAMVNLVFRRYGGSPVTGSLNIRYRHPVRANKKIVVIASVRRARLGSVWTVCRIMAGDTLCVDAEAIFRIRSDRAE
ncbi:hypothetical protein C3F09_03720 [candidate division GN15 bacterium]|uniref:Acyl-coenzyme A thioesterase THEM4 n=1 Tax=candidate division GN15 bacterium TaxID=2072418 RepID=A0A855XAK7_9BACT|nr:MAG: hypothetical protein C3F09_03720 [candidate division GN15 bacterium]